MPRPLRVTLFALGGAFMAVLIGWTAFTGLVLLSNHDVDAQADFPFSGDRLTITSDGGGVHIVPGPVGTIHVDRTVTESIRGADPSWKFEGDRLTIDTNCPMFFNVTCDGDYTVTVPLGIPLTVRSDDGAVSADGMRQPLDLRSDNGSIRVRNSVGDIKAESDNGSIKVESSVADRVSVKSDNGSLRVALLNAPTSVTGSSDNGSAKVLVPAGSGAYNVKLSSDNGSQHLNVAHDPSAPRLIDISSDNGSVTVDYAKPATPAPTP